MSGLPLSSSFQFYCARGSLWRLVKNADSWALSRDPASGGLGWSLRIYPFNKCRSEFHTGGPWATLEEMPSKKRQPWQLLLPYSLIFIRHTLAQPSPGGVSATLWPSVHMGCSAIRGLFWAPRLGCQLASKAVASWEAVIVACWPPEGQRLCLSWSSWPWDWNRIPLGGASWKSPPP